MEGTVGYSFGAWDLLHIGHVRQLKKARELCDYLVVGVFTDPVATSFKREPVISDLRRVEMLRALKPVDLVVFQHSVDPTDNLRIYKPDILFHGNDWSGIPGAEYMKSIGGKVITPPYTEGISTSKIIQSIVRRHCEQDSDNSCCGMEGRG